MFAKLAKKGRSRSAGQKSSTLPVQQQHEQVVQVHIAPELLRWSDFSTPFPSVALGGYSRFYETYPISEAREPSRFWPLLSQQPESSPSLEIPPKSLLFDTPLPSCLPLIRESSLESLTLKKPRNLTITTITKPLHTLKRRRRRLVLRTPSIERDFILGRFQSLSGIPISDESPTDNRSTFSSSSDSRSSHERSDSNFSEFPLTPSTSFENENAAVVMVSLDEPSSSSPHNESESVIASPTSPASACTVKPSESLERPISLLSYCTAKSDCEI